MSNKKRTTRFVLLSRSLSLNAATRTSEPMVEFLTLKTSQLDQLLKQLQTIKSEGLKKKPPRIHKCSWVQIQRFTINSTGEKIIDAAFNYAYTWNNRADKPFWGGDDVNEDGMPVERYDNPFMGFLHSVRRGATKGGISIANSLYSFMGADLDYLPNPQTALTPVDYGAEGEGASDTVFALTEGFSQFMVSPLSCQEELVVDLLRAYGVGAVVDFTAFDPRNGNATTFLREMGVGEETLANLDAKEVYEKDGEYSARLRSLAEGGGLGLAADATLRTALRTLRGLRRIGGEAVEDARNFSRQRKILDVSGDRIEAGGTTGLRQRF